MAVLRKRDLIQKYNSHEEKYSTLCNENVELKHSAGELKKLAANFSNLKTYDIFLSHAYNDARIVRQVRRMLEIEGYSVYVDWIEDKHIYRGKVTENTALILRNRMNSCESLIYLTSQSADQSRWMPWELGYMDARTSRVAVAPILDDDEDFTGREYLGIYPYLDLTGENFYIHRSGNEWVSFQDWKQGKNPTAH